MASTNSEARAQVFFKKAAPSTKINADAQQITAFYKQAGLYLEQRKIGLAIKSYKEAIRLNYLPAMNDLACLLMDLGGTPEQRAEYYREAWSLLHSASNLGCPAAMDTLANQYLKRDDIKYNVDEAIELYRNAVHLKYLPAMNELACLLMELAGTPEQKAEYYREAWNLLHSASKLGCPAAMNNLAGLYLWRKDIEGNVDKAIKLYRILSDLGNVDAMYKLASLYLTRDDISNNVEEAIELYRMAAVHGHADAMNKLASLLFRPTLTNKGDEIHYADALQAYHNNDKINIANTLHRLASLLNALPGNIRQQRINYVNAFVLWEEASDLNHADATYSLVALYRQRKPIGDQDRAKDLKKIVQLYKKAAMLDHVDAKYELPGAMNELACLLLKLDGTEKERAEYYNEAFDLLSKASNLSCPKAISDLAGLYFKRKNIEGNVDRAIESYRRSIFLNYLPAMNDLACLLLELDGIEKEIDEYYKKEAWDLLHNASDLGCPKAMNTLASQYLKRGDIKDNVDKAIKLYRKAIRLNYLPAMNDLACLLLELEGTEEEKTKYYKEAWCLLHSASDLDCPEAMNNLADLYLERKDIEGNVDEAIELYRMAAVLRHADAMDKLASLLFRPTFIEKGDKKHYDNALQAYQNSDKANIANTLHRLASLLDELPGNPLQKKINLVHAVALWEEAIDLNPANLTYSFALSEAMENLKNIDNLVAPQQARQSAKGLTIPPEYPKKISEEKEKILDENKVPDENKVATFRLVA